MGESEDENYVTFGTALDPLDEDNLPRKKPMTIKDQYALDEQGRRRFHGAFTGGFSAGYFNTVGTRDGWRPQQFKSSRGSKAENKAQKPEDFMDDEDVGEFGIAPTAIRATTDYTDHDKKGTKRERTSYIGDGPIPGTPVLQELLKPVKDTVGVKLLKQMGWKPGQGVGPRLSRKEKSKVKQQTDKQKIYGCPLPPEQGEKMETDSEGSEDEESSVTFAPDDYEPFRCNPKDNFFGIGYSGLDKRPILSQHVNLFEPTTFKLQEKNKKLSIRGQAFGVGGFEVEDEDIYSRDDMSQYDFSLEPQSREKSRWSKEKLGGASDRKCIQGFVPAKNCLKIGQIFEAPELPQGFKPVHVVRKSRFEPSIESTSLENARRQGLARHDLRAEDRARIINDPNPITLVLSSDSSKPVQRPSNDSLFPCVAEEEKVRPESSTPKMNLDSSDQQTVKKPSVISNIITKTLNLHGREQAARNVEIYEKKTALTDSTKKNSWLEKLNLKSFTKGGIENLTTGEETNDENPTGDSLMQQKIAADSSSDQNTEREADDSGGSLFRPFVANPDKQKRYDQFLELCKSGEKSKLCDIQPLSMTEWEREHERVEFEQAARLYKPLTGSMGDRFVSGKHQDDLNPLKIVEKTKDGDSELREAAAKKMFGKLTRQRIDWQPASILCKRFNIAEPRTRCVKQEIEKKTKFSVFDYLEESVHNSSTFQSATDVAVRLKSENLNGISRQEGSRNRLPESRITDSAMLICDNADREKVSAKERNFEAKYERIFGKNVAVLEPIEKGDKKISSGAQTGGKLSENFEDAEPVELFEDSGQRRNFPGPSEIIENVESADNLTIKTDEKKDLFKAIFLSSSEDSDSEKDEEVDDEKLKSVLIGKNSSDLNVKRNTSPPRGIFANLDLDSLQNDASGRKSKINLVEKEHSRSNLDGDIETLKVSVRDRKIDDAGTKEGAKDLKNTTGVEEEPDSEILSDMYGPILPSKPANNSKDMVNIQPETSSQSQAPKYVFKSIVVPVVKPVSSSSLDGEWIEKRKSKKSKKEKKKHKHKEHKKHKHKKHKR